MTDRRRQSVVEHIVLVDFEAGGGNDGRHMVVVVVLLVGGMVLQCMFSSTW